MVVPDGVGRDLADEPREAVDRPHHVVVVAELRRIGRVAIVVVAQHQQQVEILPGGHLAERGGGMDGTPAHARTKRHPQPPPSASRRGRDERRVGPREGRPAVEQRAVVVAGCRPQFANLHLPGERLGFGECWAIDDPPVGKRRILADPEAEARCVRSLRPESGRGVADMPDEWSGMDERLARHGRDHRHGAIGLRCWCWCWCWCWNRGCLGRTITGSFYGCLRRHDDADTARRLEEKLASRGVRHRHGLSSRESVTPANASGIIQQPTQA